MAVSINREVQLKPLGKKILRHLRNRRDISPLEAMNTYGTMRLAAHIYDLRQAGFDIDAIEKKDEEGQKYTRYYLREEPLS
jgi:hypothetical protein